MKNNPNREIKKVTIIGFIVNLLLSALKLVAGFIGRSGAILADGVHSLSDSMTDIVVLIGIRFTSQPADKCHNYGHEKYETLSTAIISLFLIVAGLEILKKGVSDIINYARGVELSPPGMIALYAAGASIVIKEILYRYTLSAAKKFNNPMLRANAWHNRSDALSSIGALLGIGGAILFSEKYAVLDPIASIIVSVFIFRVAYRILKPAISELTEKSLSIETRERIISLIDNEEGILGYHHLRSRNLGRRSVVEVHIFVDGSLSVTRSHEIATGLEKKILNELKGESMITIHVEPYLSSKAENSSS